MRSGIWKPELHPRDRLGRFREVFRSVLRLNLGEYADLGKVTKGSRNIAYARVHRTREGWEVRAQTSTGTYGIRIRPPDMASDDHFEAAVASLDVDRPFPEYDDRIINPHRYNMERRRPQAKLRVTRQARRWDPEAPGGEYEIDPDLMELSRIKQAERDQHLDAGADRTRPYGEFEEPVPGDEVLILVDGGPELLSDENGKPLGRAVVGIGTDAEADSIEVWYDEPSAPRDLIFSRFFPKEQLRVFDNTAGFGRDLPELDPTKEIPEGTEVVTSDGRTGTIAKKVDVGVYKVNVDNKIEMFGGRNLVWTPETPDDPVDMFQQFYDGLARYVGADPDKPISDDLLELARRRQARRTGARFKGTFKDADATPEGKPEEDAGDTRTDAERDAEENRAWENRIQVAAARLAQQGPDADANPDNERFERERARGVFERDLNMAVQGNVLISSVDEVEVGDEIVKVSGALNTEDRGEVIGKHGDTLLLRTVNIVDTPQGERITGMTTWSAEPNTKNPMGPQIYNTGNKAPWAGHEWKRGDIVAERGTKDKFKVVEVRQGDDDLLVVDDQGEFRRVSRYKTEPAGQVDETDLPEAPPYLLQNRQDDDYRAWQQMNDRWQERGDGDSFGSRFVRALTQESANAFMMPRDYPGQGYDDEEFQKQAGVWLRQPEPIAHADDAVEAVRDMLQMDPFEPPISLNRYVDFSSLPNLESAHLHREARQWAIKGYHKDGTFFQTFLPGELNQTWMDNQLRWHGRQEAPSQRRVPKREDNYALQIYNLQQADDVRGHIEEALGFSPDDTIWNHRARVANAEQHPAVKLGAYGLMEVRGTSVNDVYMALVMSEDFAADPNLGLATMVHEMLHGFSSRSIRGDQDEFVYMSDPRSEGWEEGPVEAAAMALRHHVAQRMGYEINEEFTNDMRAFSASTPYMGYVAALERVRRLGDMTPGEFYGHLLRTPPSKRRHMLPTMTRGVKDRAQFDMRVQEAIKALDTPTDLQQKVAEATKQRGRAVGKLSITWGRGADERLESAGITEKALKEGFFSHKLKKMGVNGELSVERTGDSVTFRFSTPYQSEVPMSAVSTYRLDTKQFGNTGMQIAENHQGSGIGREFLGHQLRMRQKMGATESYTEALSSDGNVGSYVWARMGFDFDDPNSAEEMREAFRNQLTAIRDQTEIDLDAQFSDSARVEEIVADLDERFNEAFEQVESFEHADEFANFDWALPEELGGRRFDTKQAMTDDFSNVSYELGWRGKFDLREGSRSWQIFNEIDLKMQEIDKDPTIEPGIMDLKFYTDPNGRVWLGKRDKYGSSGMITAEHVGSAITRELLGDDMAAETTLRPDDEDKLRVFGRKFDNAVTFFDHVHSPDKPATSDDYKKLTDKQRRQLLRHQVVDWLLANDDTHGGNFLVLKNGDIVGIDKGFAFGNVDEMDEMEKEGEYHNLGSVYAGLWEGHRRGHYKLDTREIDAVIDKIEQMNDLRFEAYVRGWWDEFKDTIGRDATGINEDIIQRLVDRKRNIRERWADLLTGLQRESVAEVVS